ncbi:MAG: DegT/DnrJ/EryC1/StrS family aminotransferase [Myxococcales bacterium]|nr:DegT/DnrJ/EryC1/StrS family aminotransferase [Myxococcales bacterium]
MTLSRIRYGRQTVDEADVTAVSACLRDANLTQGPRVVEFEEALARRTGARHAVAVSSATAALNVLSRAMGVGGGDSVVTTPISFLATANGFVLTGAEVAFADVDPGTARLDPASVDEVCARRARRGAPPRVIAAVDFAGQPYDRVELLRVARRWGALVVEDCAHSLGASYEVDGETHVVGSCAHGDAAVFSFHPVKHITTGEGGAILTNDADLARRARELRQHGVTRDASRFERGPDDPMVGPWYYEQQDLGWNYRLSDVQCALGVSQLAKLDAFVARRRAIAARYDAVLAEAPFAGAVAPLARIPGRHHAFHIYVVTLARRDGEALADLAMRRRAAFERMAARGVDAQVHYFPIPWQPYHRRLPRAHDAALGGAEAYYAGSFSRPRHPSLSDGDVERVIDALASAMEGG